jgi:hypothetical protein
MYRSNEPDDFYDEEDWDEDLPDPRWRRLRITIFALMMLAAILGGMIYEAWGFLPSLLGYWQDGYRVSVTQLETGDCVENAGDIFPGSSFCVCGWVDAAESQADFHIHLRDDANRTLGTVKVYNQASGRFCRAFALDQFLSPGSYSLVIQPRLARREVNRLYFEIKDNRSEV